MHSPAPAAAAATARDRIILALDVSSPDEARSVVSEVGDLIGAVKVGMQLFTVAGPDFVRELTSTGARVFLDLKFHDIPNTVANAGVEAARLGVWMFNVHASGGSEMMRTTASSVAEFCDKESIQRPLITAVTVLTSFDAETLRECGLEASVDDQVRRLASLTAESGLDGVVASAAEVELIRGAVADPSFVTVTPGIRASAATADDQKRVVTIGDAIRHGSTYVVVGRPILKAADRRGAAERLLQEAELAG